MDARRPLSQGVCQSGEELLAAKHYASRDIRQRIKNLKDKWQKLDDLAATRRTKLEDAAESHQVRPRIIITIDSLFGIYGLLR